MLNGTMININSKPENSHIVKYESIIIDAIRSQAFLFGEFDMGKSRFKRRPRPCACGCGEKTDWNKWKKKWNKYLFNHHLRTEKYYKIPLNSEMPLCKCGCKNNVTWCKWRKQWNNFLPYHQSKENQYSIGCTHTKEWKKERSKQMMGNQYAKGYIFTEKQRMGLWNWKGGIAAEPYCDVWLDKEYKEDIRIRDNHTCQNSDCWKNCNHLTLCLHHIDNNKKNCHPSNLISICRSCNARAEGGKEFPKQYWIKFYQNIMNKKYRYKYE